MLLTEANPGSHDSNRQVPLGLGQLGSGLVQKQKRINVQSRVKSGCRTCK